MYVWKDEEFKLCLTVKDLAKLARLPGTVSEYYISDVTATNPDKITTEKDDLENTVYSITFVRTTPHKPREIK